MAIASINPATGETIRTFEALDSAAIETALARASSAFRVNRERSFAERATRLLRTAELLEERKNDLGRLMTMEMGKPVRAAVAEVVKCATTCRYYADHAEGYLADEHVATDAKDSFIRYEPLGPVLAVMPWNFPFWQVFRFAAPALMAGNVALLKHASNVPQCALAIEETLRDAGFTDHEFQTLLIGSEQVESIIGDERVRAVTLTGSEPAGASVASIAAKNIKKAVLELGGSDPFIVMPSANLDDAVSTDPSPPAPTSSPAATASAPAATSTRQQSSPKSPTTPPPPAKKHSAPSPRSSAPRMLTKPSASPTTPPSASAPRYGPTTAQKSTASSTASTPAKSSSTPWSPPIPESPSAAQSTPASAESWARTASASS